MIACFVFVGLEVAQPFGFALTVWNSIVTYYRLREKNITKGSKVGYIFLIDYSLGW